MEAFVDLKVAGGDLLEGAGTWTMLFGCPVWRALFSCFRWSIGHPDSPMVLVWVRILFGATRCALGSYLVWVSSPILAPDSPIGPVIGV